MCYLFPPGLFKSDFLFRNSSIERVPSSGGTRLFRTISTLDDSILDDLRRSSSGSSIDNGSGAGGGGAATEKPRDHKTAGGAAGGSRDDSTAMLGSAFGEVRHGVMRA